MSAPKFVTIFKMVSFLMIAGIIVTLAACSTPTDDTDDPANNDTTDPVEMDATLTDLTVNGITVMGFSPETEAYVMILSSEVTTPVIEATKYASDATVSIVDAEDITSNAEADRTATITVTTVEDVTKQYSIIFQANIEAINLRSADDFVILAESAVSSETSSLVTGDIGVSPAAATYITGFSLIMDSTGTFATSSQVVGEVYASDYTSPTPSKLTTAVSDMHTAYTDAAGRTAQYTELYSGDLSGKTLTTGVYKFGSGVLINTDLTLNGSATDVWIFQIDGSLTQASATDIVLSGGALPENIFWQVADIVSIGTDSHFEGTILAMTNIAFNTNATINGSLYAQTAVTLDAATVTKP